MTRFHSQSEYRRVCATLKLECRWCKRKLDQKWRDAHETVCLLEAKRRHLFETLKAFVRVEKQRHSPAYRQRWRQLPGKGWGALAGSFQLLEVLEVSR